MLQVQATRTGGVIDLHSILHSNYDAKPGEGERQSSLVCLINDVMLELFND
jgi:hypothetical protein